MSRSSRRSAIAVIALAMFAGGAARGDEDRGAPQPLPNLTFFNGEAWAPMGRHAIYVTGAGATAAGTATATLKSKLDGPKTYVVLDGATSQVALSTPRPRFRVFADKPAASRFQLAQFEVKDDTRKSTIERGRAGTLFTRGVDLEITKVQEGLWELRPKKSLQPGEYALATSDSDPVADFTIVERGY